MDPGNAPPAHVFEGGVVPRVVGTERRADGSVAWWFDPEPLALPDGSRTVPPALLVRSPDGTHVLTRRDGMQVLTALDGRQSWMPPPAPPQAPPQPSPVVAPVPPPAAPPPEPNPIPPPAPAPAATWAAPPHATPPPAPPRRNRGALVALAVLGAAAALGGGLVLGGALGDDDDEVEAQATTTAPERTTTTTEATTALDVLDGTRFAGTFTAGPQAAVNEVVVDVTSAGIVLELHLHLPNGGGCLFVDLDPGEPLSADATENAVAASGEISLTGGASAGACEGGPDDAGPVAASIFVFVQAQTGVTGTLTLDEAEFSFTAQEV
jgi:hypothetical protein